MGGAHTGLRVSLVKPKSKKGRFIPAQQKDAILHDLQLGVLSKCAIARQHGVSEGTVRKLSKTEPREPVHTSQMNAKKFINLEKTDSLLVYALERMEEHLRTLPTGSALNLDAITRAVGGITQIKNSLMFSPVMEDPGVTEYDAQLVNEVMNELEKTNQQHLQDKIYYILSGGKKDVTTDRSKTTDTESGATAAQENNAGLNPA